MNGINKFIGIGTLGKDPEVRHLESGTTVASFSIAINEPYKDKDGNKVDNVEWVTLEAWEGLAKVAEKYLRKGSHVYVEGKIKTDTYEKDGTTVYRTKVRITNMNMLGGNAPENATTTQAEQPQNATVKEAPKNSNTQPVGAEEDDDLPF